MGFRGQTALAGFGSVVEGEVKTESAGTYGDKLIGGRLRVIGKLSSDLTWWAYVVRHEQTGLEMAVRVFDPESTGDMGATALFLAEAAAVSMLQNPHTVALLDFGEEDDGRVFLATEPPKGKTLSDIIRAAAPMEPALVARIADQVLDSLGEAHAAGLNHGELTAGNILVPNATPRDVFVKVLDYNLSRMLGESLGVGAVVDRPLGSMPYMSPEQLAGRDIDRRTDLYALAVIMFEMLTGSLPFTGVSAEELLVRKIRDAVPRPESIGVGGPFPEAVGDFLVQAMSARREARPANVEEFRDAMHVAFGLASASAAMRAKTVEMPAMRAKTVEMPAMRAKTVEMPATRAKTVEMPATHDTGAAAREAGAVLLKPSPRPAAPGAAAIRAAGGAATRMEPAPAGDRRRAQRTPKLVSARGAWKGETFRVTASDASSTGGFITSAELPPIGQRVVLAFMNQETGEFGIQVLAQVTRIADPVTCPGCVRGFGVRWLRLRSIDDYTSVVAFVRRMFGIDFPAHLPAGVRPDRWEFLFPENTFI